MNQAKIERLMKKTPNILREIKGEVIDNPEFVIIIIGKEDVNKSGTEGITIQTSMFGHTNIPTLIASLEGTKRRIVADSIMKGGAMLVSE